jgi:hypothetical protein
MRLAHYEVVRGSDGKNRKLQIVGTDAFWGEASAWWNDGNPDSGPSGWFGISDIAQDVVVGGGPYPVPTVFGPTVGYEIQGFTLNLYETPEPFTFALAGLGIAGLLIFRRRTHTHKQPRP